MHRLDGSDLYPLHFIPAGKWKLKYRADHNRNEKILIHWCRSLLLRQPPCPPQSSNHSGKNCSILVAAWKSITTPSHSYMDNSSETYTCRHLPALNSVTFPTAFQRAFCWSVHWLQWQKSCCCTWPAFPAHHQHLSFSWWLNGCEVCSSGYKPTLSLVESGSQWICAWYRNSSLGPCHTLESIAELVAALVGLPHCLGCRPPLGKWFRSIPGRSVWRLYCCASACILGNVCLAFRFVVSVDAEMFWDPVNLSCDGVGLENLHSEINLPCYSLSWAQLYVWSLSICGFRVTTDYHHCHSMLLKSVSSLGCHP